MRQFLFTIKKKFSRKKNTLSDFQTIHPSRDWTIGTGAALLVCVIGVGFSAELYIRNRVASLSQGAETQTQTIIYRESVVQQALGILNEKERRENELLSQGEPVGVDTANQIEPLEDATATSSQEISETPENVEGGIDAVILE